MPRGTKGGSLDTPRGKAGRFECPTQEGAVAQSAQSLDGGVGMHGGGVDIPPPSLGVLNLFDMAVTIGMAVAVPYPYLLVPTPVATVLLALAVAWLLLLAVEPVATRPIRWVIMVAIVARVPSSGPSGRSSRAVSRRPVSRPDELLGPDDDGTRQSWLLGEVRIGGFR
jgi:hypothetical protein